MQEMQGHETELLSSDDIQCQWLEGDKQHSSLETHSIDAAEEGDVAALGVDEDESDGLHTHRTRAAVQAR